MDGVSLREPLGLLQSCISYFQAREHSKTNQPASLVCLYSWTVPKCPTRPTFTASCSLAQQLQLAHSATWCRKHNKISGKPPRLTIAATSGRVGALVRHDPAGADRYPSDMPPSLVMMIIVTHRAQAARLAKLTRREPFLVQLARQKKARGAK